MASRKNGASRQWLNHPNLFRFFWHSKKIAKKNDAGPISNPDLMASTSLNAALTLTLSRNIRTASRRAGSALRNLGTGYRINSIFDGSAADTSKINGLDSQLRGLRQALLNVNETSSVATTADAALSAMLTDAYNLRELSQKAQDSTLTSTERDLIESEASGILTDMTNIANDTTFTNANGLNTNLLDNSFLLKEIQVGPRPGDSFFFSIGDARTSTLGKLAIYSGAQGAISAAIVGQVTFNGTTVESSVSDGVSTSSSSNSSLAIVNAINASSSTTAVYAETVGTIRTLTTDFTSAVAYRGVFSSGDFQINGVSIVGTISTATAFASAVNSQTSSTGVIAAASGSNVTLTATDGRNISITLLSGGATASFDNVYDVFNFSSNSTVFTNYATLSAGATPTWVGAIRIWSSAAITIGGTSPSNALGIAYGTQGLVSGTDVSSIDLSTTDNAAQANKVLDATIAQISTLRYQVGAVHDRLDYTAAFLLDSSNAADEAKGAVKNADFVLETTNLVVAQILQDAGVAALAQANVSLQSVTRLLENL